MNKNTLLKRLSICGIALILSCQSVFAGSIMRVNLNGNKIMLQQSPFVLNGVAYIPLRAIGENIGAIVDWDNKNQTIKIQQDNITIICNIDSNRAVANGKEVLLNEGPRIKQGTVYVPIRFVADCLGAKVVYTKEKNTLDIFYQIPIKDEVKYDKYNNKIRRTNLPTNAADFPYILQNIPNEMYELKPMYYYSTEKIISGKPHVEGKDYIKPKNIESAYFYSDENVLEWKKKIEKNLELKFDADYRTIDSTWAEEMTKTYMDSDKPSAGYYERNLADTKKYVKYIKDNQIIIEGDYYVEPSICYEHSGGMYLRCWVKYKVKSNKLEYVELYEKLAEGIKTNIWYEGYVDIKLATNVGGDSSAGKRLGEKLGINRDVISRTYGIKKAK